MSYTERIRSLWEENSEQDLSNLLTKLLKLIDEAYNASEQIPAELEMDILLNANYALGFGTKPAEARHLFRLLEYIINNYDRDLEVFNLSATKLHRLACTLIGSIISNISSSLEQLSEIVPIDQNREPAELVSYLIDKMIKTLSYGEFNKWQLELFSFITTLSLLQQDLGTEFRLTSNQSELLKSSIDSFDVETEIWIQWKDDWLEKSDYYRFTTLMITNTSAAEEKWIDQLTMLLNL